MLTTIHQAITQLKSGNIIAIPTETVYGLAADASNPAAVDKIYQIKGRLYTKPLALVVNDQEQITAWITPITKDAKKLMTAFWPGPLTLILPCADKVFSEIRRGSAGIGVRCSSCPVIREIINLFARPLALTSANVSGEDAAMTAQQVSQYFSSELFIMTGDQYITGTPSTILDLSVIPYQLLRQGEVSLGSLQTILGADLISNLG